LSIRDLASCGIQQEHLSVLRRSVAEIKHIGAVAASEGESLKGLVAPAPFLLLLALGLFVRRLCERPSTVGVP